MKKILLCLSVSALLIIALCACGKTNVSGIISEKITDTTSNVSPDASDSAEPDAITDTASGQTDTEVPPPDTQEPETSDLSGGTRIRIISYNVLCELWNDRLPVPGRDKVVADLIKEKLPDVVALQEMSTTWYSALGKLIGDEYDFINQLNLLGQSNYTGLAYNKSKVRLLQDGCEIFSEGDTDIRLMNWGYFELNESGDRFIVMSTHWNTSVDEEPKNQYRMVHAREMGQRVKELALDFECPVIAAGDFNAGRSTEEFKLYEELASTKDAQEHADVRVNADRYTMHTMGIAPPVFGNSIDHITYTATAHAVYFEHFIDQPYLNASDHTPLLCDFLIG